MKWRRRSRKPPQVRIFQCPVCGKLTPATKRKGRTVAGHIKTMYCFGCKDIRDMVQID